MSDCKASRDCVVCPSWAAWIALVRTVLRMANCSSMALSAVWTMPMASFAFAMAWPRELACALRLSAIVMPDASSAALLILRPELSLDTLLSSARPVALELT